jgi:ATP-dependent 26S proteasome regulatory subunit
LNWIEAFMLKRLSNASNAFILSTSDPIRITQFIKEVLPKFIRELRRTYYVILFDLNTNKLYSLDEAGSRNILKADLPPLEYLDSELISRPTIAVVTNAFEKRHADYLSDYLFSWANSEYLYTHGSTVVVFTTSEFLFPQPLLRFAVVISPPLPDASEREQLLSKTAKEFEAAWEAKYGGAPHPVALKPIPKTIVESSAGLTLHQCETALLENLKLDKDYNPARFNEYKIEVLKSYGLQYVEPKRGFDTVGGYDYLKDYIRNNIINVLKDPERAFRTGVRIPKGLLLFGPPGTGKTWFAKALASELNLAMVSLNPADLLRGIVGESEARTREVARIVETMAPVIVFCDEVDQIALARGSTYMGDSGVSRRVTNMLLEWLGDEDRKSFLVGATNFVRDIDPALLRPGRIDEVVPVFYPDFKARVEIVKVQLRLNGIPNSLTEQDLANIATATSMFSGAELEKLVLDAARIAFNSNAEKVSLEHLEEAKESFSVNIQERERAVEDMITDMLKLQHINRKLLQYAREYKSVELGKRIAV